VSAVSSLHFLFLPLEPSPYLDLYDRRQSVDIQPTWHTVTPSPPLPLSSIDSALPSFNEVVVAIPIAQIKIFFIILELALSPSPIP